MNSTWSPYNQQSFLGSGSQHLPLPSSHEEPFRYRAGSSLLPGFPSLSSRSTVDSAPNLQNSNYESLISSRMQSAKEPVKFYNDSMFSEFCNRKQESQPTMHNLTSSETQNDSTFPSDNYVGQVLSVNYPPPPPANAESSSPFGVLPHLEVKSPLGRPETNINDSYIPPAPKPPFSNGSYTERESPKKLPPVPSVQSPYSCETSLSPANVNSINSSNFSSPGEFSPKNAFGAYKSLQSPKPLSPSVAQHSYPSSPFTTIDSGCHPATPCSPMNGGTYVNTLNGAPARNGHKPQHSPSSAATANMLMYNTPKSQGIPNHRSTSASSLTSDYHSDYNIYSLDQNSPTSYSSAYPALHRGQMCNGNRPQLSPIARVNMQNEVHVPYGQPHSVPPPVPSPTYLQPKVIADALSSCSSSMRPPIYMSCPSMNRINSEHYPLPSTGLTNLEVDNKYAFSSSGVIEAVNDQEALEMFNSHVDSGAHSHEATNSISNFLEDELHVLNTTPLTNRQLRSGKTNDCHQANGMFSHGYENGTMLQRPISSEHLNVELLTGNPNYSYSSSFPTPIQMRNSASPKRRGRRGRRRGGNVVSFGSRGRGRGRGRREYPIINSELTSQILQIDTTQPKVPSLMSCHRSQPTESWNKCDEKKIKSYISLYSQPPSDNQKQKEIPNILNTAEIRQEVMHLTVLPIPPRRVTRNHSKYESPFVSCYLKFASERNLYPGEVCPPRAQEEQKSKSKHKKKHCFPGDELKIRFQKITTDSSTAEWRCLRGSREHPLSVSDDSESASQSSFEILPSHEIKQECDSEAEGTGNLKTVTESAKRNSVVCNETELHLNVTNCETLPAGQMQVKEEVESSEEKEVHEMPKNSGKKAKKDPPEVIDMDSKSDSETLPGKSTEPLPGSSDTDQKVDEFGVTSCRRWLSLRNRGTDSTTTTTETEPGSIKRGPDSSSDHYENFDDSDSDPAWTPAAKAAKAADNAKPVGAPPRRKVKVYRKVSTLPTRRRRAVSRDIPQRRALPMPRAAPRVPRAEPAVPRAAPALPRAAAAAVPRATPAIPRAGSAVPRASAAIPKVDSAHRKAPIATSSRPKKDLSNRFFIAKADIKHPTPYLWKTDTKSSMLQRFEVLEEDGILVYQSSYTFAAGNDRSATNYFPAIVEAQDSDTVIYLGPDLSNVNTQELFNEVSGPDVIKENFDHLREQFLVYLQSLLSQDAASTFFQEITNFNDEYFLVPLRSVEAISVEKKRKLVKNFWSSDLKKSIVNHPFVNVMGNTVLTLVCQVCEWVKGIKQLHFYGYPYDAFTLGPVSQRGLFKTHYNACERCSLAVSLYTQLHHHKYTTFSKCRSKAREVRACNRHLKRHEDVLRMCLEDSQWVDKMFRDHSAVWHASNNLS